MCYLILISTITAVLSVISNIHVVVASFERVTDIIAGSIGEVPTDIAAQATIVISAKGLPSCGNTK